MRFFIKIEFWNFDQIGAQMGFLDTRKKFSLQVDNEMTWAQFWAAAKIEQLESNLELLKWRVYDKIGFENTLNWFVSF